MRKSHHFRLYGALAHDRSTLAWSPRRALVSALERRSRGRNARFGASLHRSARPPSRGGGVTPNGPDAASRPAVAHFSCRRSCVSERLRIVTSAPSGETQKQQVPLGDRLTAGRKTLTLAI